MTTPDQAAKLLGIPPDEPLQAHIEQTLEKAKSCRWCGKPFDQRRAWQKFCTPNCRDSFHTKIGRALRENERQAHE